MYGRPMECLLLQVHALYPNGPTNGRTVDNDHAGWRCYDMFGSQAVLSFQDLPQDILNDLDSADSAESFLSISSATTLQDNDRNFGDNLAGATDESGSVGGTNTVKISSGATVKIIRGSEAQNRFVAQGGVANAPTTGTSSLLVVRVTDRNGDSPRIDRAALSDGIFGTSGDPHNLVSDPKQL